MEQEFLEMIMEERIAELMEEARVRKQGEEESLSAELEQWEEFLKTLDEEKREAAEDSLTSLIGYWEKELYRFGMADGIRIMRKIMEIK